ncbi:hypothetical protein E2C01_010442 [Portunus trituberculatus]|uniref:Uncharacterized protein n=1 Tax=Portunus trituberculatus TaxID=210409 RepID=A0A5B7D8F8_PORTR|nr:hypothetical protein [Portunus trituberculatus]
MGEDIFEEGRSWANTVGCTTDSTPAMLGCRYGFHAKVKAANSNVSKMHYMIHRYAITVEALPPPQNRM